MRDLKLPEDLRAFFDGGPDRDLDSGGYGTLRVIPPEDLAVAILPVRLTNAPFAEEDPYRYFPGHYAVPAVPLGEEPEGWFLWLPDQRRYGTFDPDHGDVSMFPADTTWTQILGDLEGYSMACEGGGTDEVPMEYLRPWPEYPYLADPALGGWGPGAWENDGASDWFQDVIEGAGLEARVEEALRRDPMEFPQEIRAAAYVLVGLGQYMLWPHGSLDSLLKLAVEKLGVIASVVADDGGPADGPSVRLELAALTARLQSLESGS